jgi:hypothetical protein
MNFAHISDVRFNRLIAAGRYEMRSSMRSFRAMGNETERLGKFTEEVVSDFTVPT